MLVVKTKKWVRSIGVFATPVLILAALVSTAQADSLVLTRVDGSFSGSGGEFNLTPANDGGPANDYVGGFAKLNGSSFQSFCLEENEYVTSGTATYDYEINTGAVTGGVGGQTSPGYDPLDPITAWLYASFIGGSLDGYDYTTGAGRRTSAGALQHAIWYSENEIGDRGNDNVEDVLSGWALSFYNAAVVADPQSIGGVRVLNLYYKGAHRQDQLIMINSVPTPSAILIGLPLLGLIGAFRVIRRRRR